jgi:hypothetical protein
LYSLTKMVKVVVQWLCKMRKNPLARLQDHFIIEDPYESDLL